MKICMVGLGSIGIQHTRNFAAIMQEESISFQIDALRTKCRPLPEDVSALITATYNSFADLPDDYDAIFLTSPTNLHFEHLLRSVEHTSHMFIEKPVFDRTDYSWQEINNDKGVFYVACPLRYHSVIGYIKEFVQSQRVYSVRGICSSYLPDWRPGIDYRECYSARASQGGGVRIDLIHEWDYLCYLFGLPSKLQHYYGTFSDLDITSEDTAVYIAEYPDKLVSLHLDYFGRARRREIELYTENDVIIGDLYNQTVRFLNDGRTVSLPQSRVEMQRAELRAFLAMTRGITENHNTIQNAVETLRVTLGEI